MEHRVIKVNGTDFLVDKDQTIMEYFFEEGIEIPHICYHESLGAIQTCDTCMVEVNGELVRACGTKIESGMVISTKTQEVKQAQKKAMDVILHNHELYCTVCEYNNGSCEIHNTVDAMGIEHQDIPYRSKGYERDMSGSFYRYDPDQCILCGRCVEVCQDVQVNETLTIDWSLKEPRVIWDKDVPMDQSSCVNCGQCSTVCPCNAMMEKDMLGEAGFLTDLERGTWRSLVEFTKDVETGYGPLFAISDTESKIRQDQIEQTKTVCTYCGVGCTFDVWTKGRKVLKIQPQPESPANGISTCIKGKFGWDYVNSEERITKPLIREDDYFREATWEEAITLVADKFKKIRKKHGPDAMGFIASSKATNEESYLMQKFARQVIGTNNIDNCSRYCQSPATKGLFRTVGYGGDAGPIDDIAAAGLVIIIGSNTAESHPVLASRIKRSHKLFGQRLIVADVRKHEMAERADYFIKPSPGTDIVWMNAVANYIIEQGWHDQSFIEKRVNEYEAYKANVQKYTLEHAEKVTNISKDVLIQIAEEIHRAGSVSICWAMGVTQHQLGSDTSTAISNLLLLTGNYGKEGSGAYPLRGHNNVQGCSDFGSMPNSFPGYENVTDPIARAKYEKVWGTKLSPEVGLDNHDMVEAIEDKKLKALFVQGEDMGVVDANMSYVNNAFDNLEFMVVQELFLTETARHADVVFPATPSLEKDGTFTNTERRIQRLYQAIEPMGDSKPDWKILTMLAQAMGFNWKYEHPSEIMDEASALADMFSGVSYDLLEGYNSLQWPVLADGTDTPRLYEERFHFEDGKARFHPVDYVNLFEQNDQYDLHVNNGRLLEHFHEGNMTYKSEGIRRKTPNSFIEISPWLAKERGIKEGALVKLSSPEGSIRGHVHITERVSGKEVFLPLNDNQKLAINHLTSNKVDKDTNTPAYKEVKANMTVLEEDGKSPIPRNNHRFGHRNPQVSVKVEEKWMRDDYFFPGEAVKQNG